MSDALPLISLNTLNAARLSSLSESSQLRTQEITARVVDSGERPSDGQYEVTLEADGRQFKVVSDQPLPKDAELKLQLLIASQKSPEKAQPDSSSPRDAVRSQAQQASKDTLTKETLPKEIDAKQTAVSDSAARELIKETVKQIRVIAIDSSKTEQSGKITPALHANQSAKIESNHSEADIAANLKRLAALLQQSEQKGQPLNLAKDISTQDLKQWLAQKLPLILIQPDRTNTTTALYEKGNHTALQSAASTSLQDPLMATNGRNTSLLRLLPTIQQLLNKPDVPSAVKQQINQYLAQLTSATEATGSQQQINNSGLNYEAKLTKLLLQVAQGVNQPTKTLTDSGSATQTTNSATNSAAPQTASSLFRQLWQQGSATSAPSTAAPFTTAATPTSSTPAASLSESQAKTAEAGTQASRAGIDTSGNQSVSDLLAATKQKLESALATATSKITGNSDSTVFSTSLSLMSDQLQQLQNSDQKAVLSKSLQLWLNQINATRAANNEPAQNLQQLSANLQERLPEGFRLLQGALAQIELEQSQRLQQSQDQWQLNIPLLVRQDQQLSEVRMQIFKEQPEDDKTEQKKQKQRWRIHLHFDLKQLGPLDVEVDMTLPKMAATFWSTQASTLAELQKQLQPLRSKLAQLGVDVETLNARHGLLAETQRNHIQTSLVDLHT
ncbi:flagellar hook-length control protein FliK [Bacterioplanoides sp.]|uniref:flagellar hook-length control protein FliK n=1 Tax=Bacterioplanoides sp. TaxID=2066072 RepID=UPI003B5C8115